MACSWLELTTKEVKIVGSIPVPGSIVSSVNILVNTYYVPLPIFLSVPKDGQYVCLEAVEGQKKKYKLQPLSVWYYDLDGHRYVWEPQRRSN